MNGIKRLIATTLICACMALTLMACESFTTPVPRTPLTRPTFTPSPLFGNIQETEYAGAQATLASGQDQISEINRQATLVSLNMAQAAATQRFIARQTQTVLDAITTVQSQDATAAAQDQGATATSQSQDATAVAQNQGATATAQSQDATAVTQNQDSTATAQSRDATATDSAYIRNVTQTVQAQVALDVQGTHTALTNATLAAYSLTATPWAAIQADIVRTRNETQRRAWWGEFVTTPLIIILAIVLVLGLIVGGVIVYQRLMPVLELHLRTIWRDNSNPLVLVSRKIVDPNSPHRRFTRWVLRQPDPPQVPSFETPQVEIIDPFESPVALWIEETEQKLRTDGRIQL